MTLGAQTLVKRALAHTCDPASYLPYSRKHKREQHRWFYTCSCPAISTLVLSISVTPCYLLTSTFGTLTTYSRFQFTESQWASIFLTFNKESIFHRALISKHHCTVNNSVIINYEGHEYTSSGFWKAVSLYSLNLASLLRADNTMVSGEILIRGQDLKLNPCA